MRAITRPMCLVLLFGWVAAGGATLAADGKEKARERLEKGVAYQEEAAGLEQRLEDVTDPQERQKLTKQRDRAYKRAAKQFSSATSKDPSLREAYDRLAEVLDRTGRYAEAVEAYGRSLALEPGDVETLARRARALLAAGRPLDARRDYEALVATDADRGAELFLAMKRWVIGQRANPGEAPPEGLDELERWIKRQEVQAGDYDLEPSGE